MLFEEREQLLEHARHNKMPLLKTHIVMIETGKAELVPFGAVQAYALLLGLDFKLIEAR